MKISESQKIARKYISMNETFLTVLKLMPSAENLIMANLWHLIIHRRMKIQFEWTQI